MENKKLLEVCDLCRKLDSIDKILASAEVKGSAQEAEYIAAQESLTNCLLSLLSERKGN